MRYHKSGTLLFSLILAACATAGTKPASSSSSTVLRRADIEASNSTSVYDVVSRLRPSWLRPAGTTITGMSGGSAAGKQVVVYLDGSQFGGIETLRTMTTAGVISIEFLTPTQAATQIRDSGPQVASAVIMIRTR